METKRGTRFWAFLTGLILVLILTVTWAEEKKPSRGAVAMVNGKAISRLDFDRMVDNVRQMHLRSGKDLVGSEIKRQALDNLIRGELLYQESQNKGIKVDEAKLNDNLSRWKKRYPTEKAFKTAMTKMKLTEAIVKMQIKREMAIEQLIDKQIAQKVTVSEAEIRAHFEKIKDRIREYLKQEKIKYEVEKYINILKERAKVERMLKDNGK